MIYCYKGVNLLVYAVEVIYVVSGFPVPIDLGIVILPLSVL